MILVILTLISNVVKRAASLSDNKDRARYSLSEERNFLPFHANTTRQGTDNFVYIHVEVLQRHHHTFYPLA